MPPRYDGAEDSTLFLLAYEEAVLEVGGGDKILTNLFPLALTGEPRAWLLNLPGSTVTSWGELCDLFTARYAAPAHHAVAALLGGSQAPPSGCHVKPFFRQIGAACKRPGAPPGWAAPEADLTFDLEDHPGSTAGSGMLPMLCTPSICNMAVTKTLIDGGAGLNLLSVEAFNLLHVLLERLGLSKPFTGVGGGAAHPLGQIRLPSPLAGEITITPSWWTLTSPASVSRTMPSSGTQLSVSSWQRLTRPTTS